MEKGIGKPPVIKEERISGRKGALALSLLALAIIGSVFIYHGRMLKEIVRDEEMAWDREGGLYKKIREKDRSHLSALGQELKNLSQEKIETEKRVAILSSERNRLENERKTLEENLQKLDKEAKETLAKQEKELKANLSQEYKNEIDILKEKAAATEKIREELLANKEALQKIEEELSGKNKELEKLNGKNKELLESLTKANRSNEYLTQKIEDLQKVRKELEEELRRKEKVNE